MHQKVHWVYTVTFDSNGGSAVTPQVRPKGAAVVKPADPTLDGWDFGGWYIGEDAYDFTQPVTANLTLTAKWTQHIHCVCGGDTNTGNHKNVGNHTTHTDELWTAWTAKDSLPTAAGNYYLVNDVDIAADITNDWCVKDVKLCLNGKKVTMNGAVISVYMGTFFSLTDCAGGGRIIGGSDAASGGSDVVRLLGSAEFNLFGGSVSNISPANRENSVVRFLWAPDAGTFNMYGGILGAPDGAAGEDSDGVYVRFLDNTYTGNIFNAYGGRVRGVISKTVEQGICDEVGTINFGGTVFESKVYLSKGSSDTPTVGGDGKIVFFYPGRIFNGAECVRIDEQNKADVFGDGKVSFEWDENGGSGKLILKDSELSGIKTKFDLEIVLLGNNKIMATNESIFTAPNKLTFSGTGRLAIENDRNSIVCNEMLVKSGDISISIQRGLALANVTKLTVNGGTLELATASAGSEFGVLYTAYGGSVDPDKVIDITLGADRRMVTGKNSDGTDAVITEPTDKNAIATAKYVYIGEKHDHCLCGGKAYDGHDSHTDISWIPWTAKDKLPDKAGNYYLVNDVTLPEGTAALPDGVNLCLNGKAVKGTGSGTKLTSNSVINVTDCGTTGSFGELELIGDNSKLVMYNSKIVSGIFNGEVVCSGEIQDGTFNGNVENNGKITGGIFYGTVSGTGTIEDSAKVAVVFDTAGGSAVDTQKILRGQKAAAPAAPAKVGSIFDSWTDGGATFDFAAPIIKDTTLTAKWKLCDHAASTEKPSCTEGANCTVCKERYSEPLGHSYGEPVYKWNGLSCTAERVCGRDASHKETETVMAAVTVTQNRSCTLDELSTYTATFTNAAFAVQKIENVKTADKLGHSFKVQQRNETQHWNKCSRCDEIDAKENHTGGTATCSAKAECAICHAKYGEIDGNHHGGLEKVDMVLATAAETGTMEHWRCNACGKLFADAAGEIEITSYDTILWKIAPTIIEGMNGKWNKGREGGLTFRSDAAYADFLEVLVDGAVIPASNYTTCPGSIVVELKADYLATLTEGEHTITVRSASGNAITSFTVGAKIFSPQTGLADGWAWEIAAVAALGILCVTAVVLVIRKRKTA